MSAGPDFPEGPVTILFTDIVGSTALRTTLGDREADALFREHDQLVRDQVAHHQGQDQKAALGDGFLTVFRSTRRALAAAVGIQRALDELNRRRSGPALTVRVGINTGEVTWQDGQLSGEAVHAASRVCAAAKGGQILVSDVTRQLAGTVPDLSFVDAGEHDLKGFPHPWRLWEVVWIRVSTRGREEVFVGRQDELAFLRTKLTSALDGFGGLALVGGEPGVGKTTLVRELIRDAQARGAVALFGRCYDFEGAMPYSPFIEMLEQALTLMPPELVREDMGEDAAEVARMVPALRRTFPDIPEPFDLPPEQQRRYFFNAVTAFLERAAARFPLLLVLDDVHWADVPTLLLIEHVAANLPSMRVLGVGTYRDVELDVSRPLVATMDRMVRNRTVERIGLKRFDQAGVARMVEALAGREPPSEVVKVILDETEGNPFFVMEVFRHLAEEGRLFDATGGFRSDLRVDELDVPESVRLVVGRRLERLGPEAQRALAAGAVVGRGFPFALLEAITDLDPKALLDVVEEAEAARVVVPEDRGGAIHYTFAHELIRQTLLTSLSLLRRQRLHLAVADAMERLEVNARAVNPSEVAHHLLQAGAAADPARTLSYLEAAADRAMASAAFEEAQQAISDALAILGPEEQERRVELRHRQGMVAQALGHYQESVEVLDGVVSDLASLGRRDEAAAVCWTLGYQCIWLNRFEDAFLAYQRGAEIVGEERTPAAAALVGSQGVLLGLSGLPGGYEASVEALDASEALARELGDDRELARASWGRSVVSWAYLRLPEAEHAAREATRAARAAGDLSLLADSLAWLSFPTGASGALSECRAAASEALELALRLGHITAEIVARRGLLIAHGFEVADLDVMEEAVRKDLQLCSDIDSPWRSQSWAWLSFVLTMRGDVEAGHEAAARAAEGEPASAWGGAAWSAQLSNRALAGDRAAVEDLLRSRGGQLRSKEGLSTFGGYLGATVAAEAAALVGDGATCAALYPLLADDPGRTLVRPFDWVLTQRVLGMAAAGAGLHQEARAHFQAALEQAATVPVRVDEPCVHHRYGEVLLRDRDDAARGHLDRALEGYKRLGMTLLAHEVEALLTST